MAGDALRSYLGDIGPLPTLSRRGEIDLSRRIEACTRAYRRALFGIPFVARYLLERWLDLRQRVRATAILGAPDPNRGDSASAERVDRALATVAGILERRGSSNRSATEGERRAAARVDAALAEALLEADLSASVVEAAFRELLRRAIEVESAAELEELTGLDPEESQRRIDEVQHHRDQLMRAKHRFVERNLKLVVALARRFGGMGVPLADLIQEGNIGLIRAVEKFDHDRQIRFSTYAAWWIRQALVRAVQEQSRTVRLSRHMYDRIRRYESARSSLQMRLGRRPSRSEIREAAELDERMTEQVLWFRSRELSLESPSPGTDSRPLTERVPEPRTPNLLEAIDRARSWPAVRDLIDTLDARERAVLHWRFGLDDEDPLTLRQIGEKLRISHERTRQIEAKALQKLRKRAAGDLRERAHC